MPPGMKTEEEALTEVVTELEKAAEEKQGDMVEAGHLIDLRPSAASPASRPASRPVMHQRRNRTTPLGQATSLAAPSRSRFGF